MLETLLHFPIYLYRMVLNLARDSFTIAFPFGRAMESVETTNFNVIIFCFYFQSYDHCWCYGWRNYLVSTLKINVFAMLVHLFSGDCY